MEDLHLSSLPTPFSLPLWFCQADSALHFSKSFPADGKVNVLPIQQGYLVAILLYSPLPTSTPTRFLKIWLGRKW